MFKLYFTDGDLITIFDSSDLTAAIQCSRSLKLTIFLNNQDEKVEPSEGKLNLAALGNYNALRKEIMAIRDQAIRILDKMEGPKSAPLDIPNGETPAHVEQEIKQSVPTVKPAPIHAKEFDPYQQQQQQQQHPDVKPVVDKVFEAFGVADTAVTDGSTTPKPQGLQPQMGQQQQGMMGLPQPQQQQSQQPPLGSPYPSAYQPAQQQQQMGQQQLRFPQPQTSTGYTLPVQQQTSTYPGKTYLILILLNSYNSAEHLHFIKFCSSSSWWIQPSTTPTTAAAIGLRSIDAFLCSSGSPDSTTATTGPGLHQWS